MISIYCHRNKINGKCYVGQTRKSPAHRWDNGNGYKKQLKFYNAILKYGWVNFEHIILAEVETQEEADFLEQKYIQEYNCINGGYNIALGGIINSTGSQAVHVWCYNENGELIGDYNSISEAAEDIGKPEGTSNISKSCKQGTSAYGFYWSTYELSKEEVLERQKVIIENSMHGVAAMCEKARKPVVMIDLTTRNIIKEFDSNTSASRVTGVNPNIISSDCKKTRVTKCFKRSFIFQYKGQNNFTKEVD